MAETQMAVMKYQARDGQTITLSFETIRKYLVQGKAELVTQSEFMYFMGVCKSQGMNPFKRDCYLIKYDHTPAAVVTSIHFLRSRAKAMSDCTGWEAGIIVLRNKEVVYSNGLMLEGDILLGGWARGKPKGWDKERHHEVNLKGYIKHRKDGSITQFWAEENQPSQIAKVAEGQLVRAIWPDQFQNLYTDAEISPDDDTRLLGNKEIKPEEGKDLTDLIIQFDASIPKDIDLETLQRFLAMCSKHFDKSVDEIKAEATKDSSTFWGQFREWAEKEKPTKEDSIRKLYKGLGDKNFRKLVLAEKEEISNWPKENKDEMEASWKKRFGDEPYPPYPVPKTPAGPDAESKDVPPNSMNSYGEGMQSEPDVTEGDPGAETPTEKILRLVPGAKMDDNLKQPTVKCPNREGRWIAANWCLQNCPDRGECKPWAEYDKE